MISETWFGCSPAVKKPTTSFRSAVYNFIASNWSDMRVDEVHNTKQSMPICAVQLKKYGEAVDGNVCEYAWILLFKSAFTGKTNLEI